MRDSCKHSIGYINFDDKHMYFTSSGNWSAVEELGELNKDVYRSSSFDRYKARIFFLILFVGAAVLFTLKGFKVDLLLIIIIPAAFFAAFNDLSTSSSSKFKIPYSKIESIEIGSNTADIYFSDFNGKNEKYHHVEGLYNEGIDLLSKLSDNIQRRDLSDQDSDMTQWEI